MFHRFFCFNAYLPYANKRKPPKIGGFAFNFFERLKFCEVLNRSNHLAGVGVFVVVPGNDFNKRRAVAHGHALRLRSIEQRTVGDTYVIQQTE